MKADIVTIFPDFFRGPLNYGITRRAQEMGLVTVQVHDLREFAHDRHRTVDDRPFGGGEGMVLKPEPLFECLDSLQVAPREERLAGRVKQLVILMSPQGRPFTQNVAAELAQFDRVVFICGRYEGVDERVADFLADREISIGDYVLSGGEIAAVVMLEAITRLLPGAVGNEASTQQESFTLRQKNVNEKDAVTLDLKDVKEKAVKEKNAKRKVVDGADSTCGSNGLLDYPHYTRPAQFRGMDVPEALMTGNHEEIRRWRRQRALEKTLRNRPDLLEGAALTEADKKFLAGLK
jgi:tRNA (guanine37-N1)-methyltransferase